MLIFKTGVCPYLPVYTSKWYDIVCTFPVLMLLLELIVHCMYVWNKLYHQENNGIEQEACSTLWYRTIESQWE